MTSKAAIIRIECTNCIAAKAVMSDVENERCNHSASENTMNVTCIPVTPVIASTPQGSPVSSKVRSINAAPHECPTATKIKPKSYADVAAADPNSGSSAGTTKQPKKSKKVNRGKTVLPDLTERVAQLEKQLQEVAKPSAPLIPQSSLKPGRERCFIVMNATESMKNTAAERIIDDQEFLQSLVSKLFDDDEDGITVISAFRLGKKSDEPNLKPRPLKVILNSEGECRRVLSRCYRLKGEPFRVLRDLSPEDRIRMRQAVQELKARKATGELNLRIEDFRVVVRPPRVVWHPISLRPRIPVLDLLE